MSTGNFNLYLLPSFLRAICGIFVVVPVSTYYLDPKDFGIVAIIMAIVAPIGPLATSGSAWVLGGHYFKVEEKERKELLFSLNIVDFVLKTLWVVIFWIAFHWILELTIKDYQPEYRSYANFALCGVWFGMFSPTIRQLLVLQGRAFLHFVLEITSWLTGLFATILCLAWFKLGLVSLIIAPMIGNLSTLTIELFIIHRNSRYGFYPKWIKEVVRLGLPSIPANLSETLGNMADRYFIQAWINLTQLGLYSHAQGYSGFFKMIIKAFNRTISPNSLKAFSTNDKEEIQKLTSLIIRVYWVLVCMGIILTLFAYDIIKVLTHGKFVAAAPYLPLWFLLVFSQVYGALFNFYLNANKKVMLLMQSMMLTSIIFVGITALAVYYFGGYGAILSVIGSNFTIQMWRRIYAAKHGCKVNFELHFWLGIFVFTAVYFIAHSIELPLLFKFCIALVLISGVVYKFRMQIACMLKSFGGEKANT